MSVFFSADSLDNTDFTVIRDCGFIDKLFRLLFRIESIPVSLAILCSFLLQRKHFVLFLLSGSLCILPLPTATRLMII